MELTEKARNAYSEMVSLIEKEVAELSHGHTGGAGMVGGLPQLCAHMGHSRTPSACSAISFSSSILSEPISENYPHSEPETDSRGYEIVKVATKDAITRDANKLNNAQRLGEAIGFKDIPADIGKSANDNTKNSTCMTNGEIELDTDNVAVVTYNNPKHLNEIDEGNEADTEDAGDVGHHRIKSRSNSNERSRRGNRSNNSRDSDSDSDDDEDEEKDDTVPHLPHSLQSSLVDLNAEILSQHSCKTVDLSAEALSTHSSHTLVDTTTTSKIGNTSDMVQSVTPAGSREGGATTPKLRPIDKEKMIESWVVEAQQQMERFKVRSENK